jgi:hypothetical protein
MDKDNVLKGKFVTRITIEQISTGQIREVIDGFVLVQFDVLKGAAPKLPMRLVSFEETCCNAGGDKVWGFFDTREELDAYIAWLETSDENASIISLVHKTPQ